MKFNIENLRKDANLTQKQVADVLNMSKSNYGHIERGFVDLTLEVAIKLTKLFNCSLNDIAGIKEDINITRSDFKKIKDATTQVLDIIKKYDK